MEKKFVRWYDKDPDLSYLMAFIEKLSDDVRDDIAQDLIQIILSEIKVNNDDEISQLGQSQLKQYRRWYDHNISLHSAVEMIRNLDDVKRKEIVYLIKESIIQILAGRNDE